MNRNWGYNRADKDFKSPTDLVRMLVDIASKGGNLLLNVGPTAEGVFPPESVERLEAIGAWMRVNGDAIHGTQASPFPSLPWGRATRRAIDGGLTRLYLHVFEWPPGGRLVVPGLLNEPRRAFLLADSSARPLPLERQGDDLVLSLPRIAPDAIDTVVVLDVTGRPTVAIPPAIAADEPVEPVFTTCSAALQGCPEQGPYRDPISCFSFSSNPSYGCAPAMRTPLAMQPLVFLDRRAPRRVDE